MSEKSDKSFCFCCANCSARQRHSEFQKIVELKELGLTMYRYLLHPRTSRHDVEVYVGGASVQPADSNEIFILHNTRNNEISPADYVLALDRKPIHCLRCRQTVRRAQRLLQHAEPLGRKDVQGICEHCLSRKAYLRLAQPCLECQEVVKKFAASMAINSALRSAFEARHPQLKHCRSLQHDPNIEQMFQSGEDIFEEKDRALKIRDYGKKRPTALEPRKLLSGESIKAINEPQNVRFEMKPEIIEPKKFTLLETLASMNEPDLAMLIHNIKIALEERVDTSSIIGKTDEEIENRIFQAIASTKKDSDMERHIFLLINAQEVAKSKLSEMRKRLQEQHITIEDMPKLYKESERPLDPRTSLIRKDNALKMKETLRKDSETRKTVSRIVQAVDNEQEIIKVIKKFVQLKLLKSEDATKIFDLSIYEYNERYKRKQTETKGEVEEKERTSEHSLEEPRKLSLERPVVLSKGPASTATKIYGSLEKLVEQKIMQEKAPVMKQARDVAKLMRKQLDAMRRQSFNILDPREYSKQKRKPLTKSEEDIMRLGGLIRKKLAKAKDLGQSKENLPPILHKLLGQNLETIEDSEFAGTMPDEKKLYTETLQPLKPSRKKEGEPSSQYDLSKETETSSKTRIAGSPEAIKESEMGAKSRDEHLDKSYTVKAEIAEKEYQETNEPRIGGSEGVEKHRKKDGIGIKSTKEDKYSSKREIKGMKEDKDKTFISKFIESDKGVTGKSPKYPVKKDKLERAVTKSGKIKDLSAIKEGHVLTEKSVKSKSRLEKLLKPLPEVPVIIEDETPEMKAERERRERKEKMKNIQEVSEKLKKALNKKLEAKRKEGKIEQSKIEEESDKNIPMDVLVRKINKMLIKQDKEEKKALKMKKKLEKREHEIRSKAYERTAEQEEHLGDSVELPEISASPRPRIYSSSLNIIKADTGEEYIQLPYKSIRLKTPSIDDLILRLVKVRQSKYKKSRDITTMALLEAIARERLKKINKRSDKESDSDSDYFLDIESLLAGKIKETCEIIVGNEILTQKEAKKYEALNRKYSKPLPSVFKSTFEIPCLDETIKSIRELSTVTVQPSKDDKGKLKVRPTEIREDATGVLRYKLSDKQFIDNGWTQLPTQKIFRRMNLYRMRPAHPEFDWFQNNKSKGYMLYDTKELLAVFDNSGHGRWYYRNGKVALDFYDAEGLNAKQRIVIYSTGEPRKGRQQPVTVLGSFDYCGNGIVLDHSGKIRLKYNQTEGLLLDSTIGPLSHWKWHDLNEPPKFQQAWVESKDKLRDRTIQNLCEKYEIAEKTEVDDVERVAIEHENYVKEKVDLVKRGSRKFKPFPIRMKVVKLNEHFTLRVLDQANIYIMFRDGSTNLKLNIGMKLDPCEIVDIEFLEVKPKFESHLEKFPALSDSIDKLQANISKAKKFSRAVKKREDWLQPKLPTDPSDKVAGFLTQPHNTPLPDYSVTFSGCDCKLDATF